MPSCKRSGVSLLAVDYAEGRRIEVRVRRSELNAIESVKGFQSKLDLKIILNVSGFEQRHGQVVYSWLEQVRHGTRRVSEGERRGVGVLGGVEISIQTLGDHIATRTLTFGHESEKPSVVDLIALAEAAVRIHQRAIKEKRIHLLKEFANKIMAEICTGELLQVVSNLILNALEALPTNGTLRLRLRRRPHQVELLIADNGHGLPSHHTDSIFQPFFTTKGDRSTLSCILRCGS